MPEFLDASMKFSRPLLIASACVLATVMAGPQAFARGRPEAPQRRVLVHSENIQRQQPTPVRNAPIEPERAASPAAAPGEDARQPQRSGRLSVEERKALRRQIDDASRDVYRAPPAH